MARAMNIADHEQKNLVILQRLAAQGLSERKIAARLGRSLSWARDHIIQLRQRQDWLIQTEGIDKST